MNKTALKLIIQLPIVVVLFFFCNNTNTNIERIDTHMNAYLKGRADLKPEQFYSYNAMKAYGIL